MDFRLSEDQEALRDGIRTFCDGRFPAEKLGECAREGGFDRALRRELGHVLAELDALWAMVKLSVSKASRSGVPGLEGSLIKLYYTELFQRIAELGVRLLGRAGLAREDVAGLPGRLVLHRHLNSLSLTIAAGSSQIQRNIVAERMLGLPKDR